MPYRDIIQTLRGQIQQGRRDQVLQVVHEQKLNLDYVLYLVIDDADRTKKTGNLREFDADMVIAQILLTAGANPYYKGFWENRISSLWTIATSDLLESCSDATSYFVGHFFSSTCHNFSSSKREAFFCLKRASKLGHDNVVELILLCHPDLMDTKKMRKQYYYSNGDRYNSPLDRSVEHDRRSTSLLLLAHGAEVSSIYSRNITEVQTHTYCAGPMTRTEETPIYSINTAFESANQDTREAVCSMDEAYNPSLNFLLKLRVQNFLIPCASYFLGAGIPTFEIAGSKIIEYFNYCPETQSLLRAYRHLTKMISASIYHYNKVHKLGGEISGYLHRRGLTRELIQKTNFFYLFSPVTSAFPTDGMHGCINDLGEAMFSRIAVRERMRPRPRRKNPCQRVCSNKCTIL